MKHQKILNFLNETNDSKFVTRKWNVVNDNSKSNYDATSEITYNTEILKSNLCHYSDAYILVRGDITVAAAPATLVAFKNCPPFTKCITKIDETTIDDAENLDLVMPVHNLIEYSSNYSETMESLWFYSKDEAANFNNNIANFKSFKYKAKLLGNTFVQPAPNPTNETLKNATIVVPLKYLSNFWRSLEMPLINCNVEIKLRSTKHCVLFVAGTDNANGNNDDNNIIFTIKDTKLYVTVVTLSARDNQKLSKLLSKGFEISAYWNEYKTKSDNKYTTNEFRYFLESNFVVVNRLFVLVYNNNAQRFNARKYFLPKGIIKNYNVIINGKNFYDQENDSDIKRYKEIRKLTTEQGEDNTTRCLLDYEYIIID